MIGQNLRQLSNIPGWRTNRKIIVIESDDWGSIRMPSLKTYNSLQRKGLDLTKGDSARYNMYDTLANAVDLEALFEILSSVTDKNGNHAIFTAISLVANPDFEKIKSHNYQDYYYEPITISLKKYGHHKAFNMWQEGIRNNLFVPQFHGREHLNVKTWIRALQNNDPETRLAFENGFWGFSPKITKPVSYQAAFDVEHQEDLAYQKTVISEGLDLFNHLHGYKASLIVPPNGPFNAQLEKTTFEHGIKYISTSKIHHEPQGNNNHITKYFWMGKKNSLGQRYMTRNAFFEPSLKGNDWISSCLNEIQLAFRWHKPATISTHRVNYIGSIDESNRSNGLIQLKQFLNKILQNWPDAEFMTSDQLGSHITNK